MTVTNGKKLLSQKLLKFIEYEIKTFSLFAVVFAKDDKSDKSWTNS